MVAAAIRTIFAQPDAAAVAERFDRIATTLRASRRHGGQLRRCPRRPPGVLGLPAGALAQGGRPDGSINRSPSSATTPTIITGGSRPDRNSRWHDYDMVEPTQTLDELIAEIDDGPTGSS